MNQTHSNSVAFVCDNPITTCSQQPKFGYQYLDPCRDGACEDLRHESPLSTDAIMAPFSALKGWGEVVADAVITCHSSFILSVRTADCLPILVKAPPYTGVIHAGRKGTLAGITRRVGQFLKQQKVATPQVWFGPHSCVFCYQVDQKTTTHFDLLTENIQQFNEGFGQLISPIVSPYCTQCHHSFLYSYRCGDWVERNIFYLG